MDLIKISNIKSISKAEAAFNRLVDIAYIKEVGEDHIMAIGANPDLSDMEEFKWIKSIVQRVMYDAGEKNVLVEKLAQEWAEITYATFGPTQRG